VPAPPPPHRFLKFLRTIDRQVPQGFEIHLIAAIEAYLQANNTNPQPFLWTATADQILEKVRRGRVTLAGITS
jgi:hypothetical protein